MFEKLGKLTYRQLKSDQTFTEEIAAVISQIDTLGMQIVKQKAKIETAKAQRAEEKAKKAEEKELVKRTSDTAEDKESDACVASVREMLDTSISD